MKKQILRVEKRMCPKKIDMRKKRKLVNLFAVNNINKALLGKRKIYYSPGQKF